MAGDALLMLQADRVTTRTMCGWRRSQGMGGRGGGRTLVGQQPSACSRDKAWQERACLLLCAQDTRPIADVSLPQINESQDRCSRSEARSSSQVQTRGHSSPLRPPRRFDIRTACRRRRRWRALAGFADTGRGTHSRGGERRGGQGRSGAGWDPEREPRWSEGGSAGEGGSAEENYGGREEGGAARSALVRRSSSFADRVMGGCGRHWLWIHVVTD